MNTKDLELQLCSNDPIYVRGVPIYPISIKRISKIGYSKFNSDVQLLCMTEDKIKELTGNDISDIGIYIYLVINALQNKQWMDVMLFWLSEFTRNRLVFSEKNLSFIGRTFEINKDNFDEIQSIIRLRNGWQDSPDEEDNPENEAARRVLERRRQERKKRRKAKLGNEDESDITLADLVSILASSLGMTMDQVMLYDLYQFNNQFSRIKIKDDYDITIQALLHGASKDDIKFTHWITKIKHDSEE